MGVLANKHVVSNFFPLASMDFVEAVLEISGESQMGAVGRY